MESWQAILAAGAAVAGALTWLARVLRPLVPLACDVARVYIMRIDDLQRREALLTLVRAAEEVFGPNTGPQKLQHVLDEGRALGYEFSETEVSAAAREITKELGALQERLPFDSAPP